jgi:hypothetical protein
VVSRQRFERGAETSQGILRGTDTEQATVLLHHVDSGSPIARIDHQAHCAVRIQDIAKGAKTEVRVRQVMEHARTNHHVERVSKFLDALDREAM